MPIRFRWRDFLAPSQILRLHATLARTEWMPPAQRAVFCNRLLAKTIRHAYERVPHWRDLFDRHHLKPSDIRTPADLAKLPIMERSVLAGSGDRLLARGVRVRATTHTSGTTGQIVTVHHDRRTNALEFVYYWRYWGWAGYRLGDHFGQVVNAPLLGAPLACDRPLVRWEPLVRRLLINAQAVQRETAHRIADALHRYRLRFLKGVVTGVYALARAFDLAGVEAPPFQAVFSTGAPVPPAWRALISRTFHAPVIDSYGLMERCAAISQCPAGGYHVHEEYGALELTDVRLREPFGRALGTAVGTTLHNFVMPLIRYNTGDLIEPAPPGAVCPCGRTLPLVAGILGRHEHFVLTPSGRVVQGLLSLRAHVPGLEFGQYIQEGPERLVARVCCGPGYTPTSDAMLRAIIRRLTGGEMHIEIERVEFERLERTAVGKVAEVIARDVPHPSQQSQNL